MTTPPPSSSNSEISLPQKSPNTPSQSTSWSGFAPQSALYTLSSLCHSQSVTHLSEFSLNFVSQVVKRLPKTRSGKIMRRVLRKVATETSSDLGDVSTLDDPSVVKEIIEAHKRYRTKEKEDKKS